MPQSLIAFASPASTNNQTSTSKTGTGNSAGYGDIGSTAAGSDSEYVTVEDETEQKDQKKPNQQSSVNGEQVEMSVRKAQTAEFRRAGIAAVGFAMGIVGLWGDGA